MEKHHRGEWGSNLGFLMAAVGSAVGLGNIWAFPYKMGEGGGSGRLPDSGRYHRLQHHAV